MYGDSGNDIIVSVDRNNRPEKDTVFCGSGRDEVYADRLDRIADDCEKIRRLL